MIILSKSYLILKCYNLYVDDIKEFIMAFSKFKKMDFQSINPINELYGDFTVISASKTDEDVMDYDSLIAILERIDFMKNQDDAEEKTK